MNLMLINKSFEADGVFGQLVIEDGQEIAVTLQHSYVADGGYVSKIPEGSYLCKRGKHQLAGMTHSFETFEVEGVSGHTGILFHTGNSNEDSEGCILLGEQRAGNVIENSRVAFERFMSIQAGIDEFTLTVLNAET
jgi:hypothetical protein